MSPKDAAKLLDDIDDSVAYSQTSGWIQCALTDPSCGALSFYDVDSVMHAFGTLGGVRALSALSTLVVEMRKDCVNGEVQRLWTGRFAALYPNVHDARAAAERMLLYARETFRNLAEEVQARAGAKGLVHPGPHVFTLSVGIAPRPDVGCTAQGWLTAAREVLARAIQQGGNRVEVTG